VTEAWSSGSRRAVQDFVQHHLGSAGDVDTPHALSMALCDTGASTPVLLLQATGTDAAVPVMHLAQRQQVAGAATCALQHELEHEESVQFELRVLQLGECSDAQLSKEVHAAAATGHWVRSCSWPGLLGAAVLSRVHLHRRSQHEGEKASLRINQPENSRRSSS
jgi:hypothetical protein